MSMARVGLVLALTLAVLTCSSWARQGVVPLGSRSAVINISATEYGAQPGPSQSYWYSPFTQDGGPLLEYTVQAGTYTFRIVTPSANPNATYTGWSFNQNDSNAWVTHYLVFTTTNMAVDLFQGANPLGVDAGYANAAAAFEGAVTAGDRITYWYFPEATTLIFAVADYALTDNLDGVSVEVFRIDCCAGSMNTGSPDTIR
jgi:hypothetical protein